MLRVSVTDLTAQPLPAPREEGRDDRGLRARGSRRAPQGRVPAFFGRRRPAAPPR